MKHSAMTQALNITTHDRKRTITKPSTLKTFLDNHILHHALLSCFPGHVYWKNSEGFYLGCNEQQAKSLGLSSSNDIIGKSDFDLPWEKRDAEKFRENDLRIMRTGHPEIIEEHAYFNGKPSFVLSQKIPLRNPHNEVVGLLGISIDISERKQFEAFLKKSKEEAEAAHQAKSEFMAVASHELRTPLTGILGMIDFLTQDSLPEKEKHTYLKNLSHASQHLLALVNAILDFTKLEQNQWELISEPFNLKQLIEETISMLTATAKVKQLALLIDYPSDVPCNVIGDTRALRQILANLLNNAIKFTHQGHVCIRIQHHHLTSESASFTLAVEDTGIGIPHDKQNIIFNSFSQLASPYTRATSQAGTGLGLAIIQKLIEKMKGKIFVASQLNHGSTFIVEIPLKLQIHTKGASL